MKKVTMVLAMSLITLMAGAQGSVEIKDLSGAGQKKFKKAPKKVYIAEFRVMYQLLFSQVEVAEGGREIGGGYRGDAKAGLTMAVQGVNEQDIKDVTNDLYQNYVKKLQGAGYEVLNADAASGTKAYEDWERKTGGGLNEAQVPGYIMSTPSNFDYYVKRTNKKGKEKKSFIPNTHKVSAELGGAVVISVNVVVPFVVDAESRASKAVSKTIGGLAKIVMKPDLRIEKEITHGAQTKVSYVYAEKKVAVDAVSNWVLKNNIDIPGVFEEKKYKASESADQDLWGSDYGALTVYHVNDKYLSKTHPIPCEKEKYKQGVLDASTNYLDATLTNFFNYAAGKKK